MRLRSLYFTSFVAIAACGSVGTSGDALPGAGETGPATAGAPTTTAPSPSSSASAPGTPPATATGVLLFATAAPISGVSFSSGTHSGTTDSAGTFTYETGAPVSFVYGTQMLGSAPGAALLSPYQLAGSTTCDDTPALQSLVALLEALDTDQNPANGITVPSPAAATPTLPALDVALHTFITAFDGEAWQEKSSDTFELLSAVLRGQGVATDGTSWFFSGETGIEQTTAAFSSMQKNLLAIPPLLIAAGSDHIGDIDVLDGTIYAPVEDKGYHAPKVVLYDVATLTAGTVYDIPWNLQTMGVPWVAVDGPRAKAYLAEWDPTPAINVFTLATMVYEKSIPLVTTIGRVQGGKVYKGALYLSTDDTVKTIYKVHLGTGTVIPLFALNLTDVEEEGLAFFARPDGTLLHTLNVTPSRTGSELRHHQITRQPLRWNVCP